MDLIGFLLKAGILLGLDTGPAAMVAEKGSPEEKS